MFPILIEIREHVSTHLKKVGHKQIFDYVVGKIFIFGDIRIQFGVFEYSFQSKFILSLVCTSCKKWLT